MQYMQISQKQRSYSEASSTLHKRDVRFGDFIELGRISDCFPYRANGRLAISQNTAVSLLLVIVFMQQFFELFNGIDFTAKNSVRRRVTQKVPVHTYDSIGIHKRLNISLSQKGHWQNEIAVHAYYDTST